MAIPLTRQDFIEFCLRKLGHGAVHISVTDEQLDDRVDEALEKFWQFNTDGTERIFIQHQLTSDDVTNQSITISDDIIGVTNMFDLGMTGFGTGVDILNNVPFQIYMSDIAAMDMTNMSNYVIMRINLQTMVEFLVGKPIIRYNQHTNIVHIDVAKAKLRVGSWIVLEGFQKVNPETYNNVWKDLWLQRYATQLIKQQWGQNLSIYSGIQLPGQVTLDGPRIYNEATEALAELDARLVTDYSAPISIFIG